MKNEEAEDDETRRHLWKSASIEERHGPDKATTVSESDSTLCAIVT